MNFLSRSTAEPTAASVADTIRERLLATKSAELIAIEQKLSAQRNERAALFNEHQRAALAHHEDPTVALARAVTDAQERVEIADAEIRETRALMRTARDRHHTAFVAAAREYNHAIADRVEAAIDILALAAAELGAIDQAASLLGVMPVWGGRLSSIDALRAFAQELRR